MNGNMHKLRLLHGSGRIAMLFLLVVWLVGCANYIAPVKPPGGLLFTMTKAPLTTNYNSTPCCSAAKKTSISSTLYFHDIILTGLSFGWDEVAIAEMAHKGGITEVAYADYEILNILGVFAKFTINIYGN